MKICLAGEGAMGGNHIKALAAIDGVEVAALAGGIEEDTKKFADEWNIPFWTMNLEEAIERPGIDAVILTTPSHLHSDQAEMVLGKGKHVLVEIPMSLNLADAERVQAAKEAAGKVCMVAHTRRFSPPHSDIRRRLQAGEFHLHHMIVETYFFRRTNLNMFGQPRTWVDNLLWHHACHSLDLFQWVIGDADLEVWGQKGPNHGELDVPMDMTIGMRSESGILFSMAMSFNNKGPFGGFYRYIGEEETYKVFREEITDSEGNDLSRPGSAFEIQDREFVAAIREGREPESSAASCVPAMALLERIQAIMDAG